MKASCRVSAAYKAYRQARHTERLFAQHMVIAGTWHHGMQHIAQRSRCDRVERPARREDQFALVSGCDLELVIAHHGGTDRTVAECPAVAPGDVDLIAN